MQVRLVGHKTYVTITSTITNRSKTIKRYILLLQAPELIYFLDLGYNN
nr:hypothetical protein [Thomasclavelia cocleata]